MRGQNNISVFYIGLHPNTPAWVTGEKLHLVAVSRIDNLFHATLNPADLVFQIIYAARGRDFWLLERVLLPLYSATSWISTKVYRNYHHYLRHLVRNRVRIVNMRDDNAIAALFERDAPQLIVVNSWSLLPEWLIQKPALGAINIHPSKLPRHRGALPTLWSLKEGDTQSAVSVMLLNKEIDKGDVIAQYDFDILEHDTSITIEEKVDHLLKNNLRATILGYLAGSITPLPQTGEESATGKYEPYRRILWTSERAKDIKNKVELYPHLEPHLYCYSTLGKSRIHFKAISSSKKVFLAEPGFFIIKDMQIHIKTTDGVLSARLFLDIPFIESVFLLIKVGAKRLT